MRFFDLFETHLLPARRLRLAAIAVLDDVLRQISQIDDWRISEYDRALDQVFEFSDIAGPGVEHQGFHGARTDLREPPVVSFAGPGEKLLREQGNILDAIFEIRHSDMSDEQAIIEILPESPGADFGLKIPVRGGDDTDIDFTRPVAAQSRHFLRFDDTEQFRLNGYR